MEIMSHVLPGNFTEKERLKSNVPQLAREKHKWATACNQTHICV